MLKCFQVSLLIALFCVCGAAQNPAGQQPDPMAGITTELTKISRSVQALNEQFKVFLERSEKAGGTLTEKQQDLIFGMEMLIRTEQLIALFQRSQVDLTEKLNETRGKIAQIDVEIRPRSIDRSVALVGTTETDELRDNRRQRLQADRQSLSSLFSQIQEQLSDNNDKLRNAQIMANTLRRQYLPQIDKEIFKP